MADLLAPGFVLGCTSFVRPDRYVPGVRYAAQRCRDVSLLLFEREAFPTASEIQEIARIGRGEGTSFSLHLPADADLSAAQGIRDLKEAALAAVERTAPLEPHSFVLHLAFPHETCRSERFPALREETARMLAELAAALPGPESLALENLEGYPADFLDFWGFSRCLDVGHLWKDACRGRGEPPEALLPRWLPRTRIIHLHGVRQEGNRVRDHLSLAHMPERHIDAVLHPLWRTGFDGVITLEVFAPEALERSHRAILESHERYS